jgi:hypothetical protein
MIEANRCGLGSPRSDTYTTGSGALLNTICGTVGAMPTIVNHGCGAVGAAALASRIRCPIGSASGKNIEAKR